MLRRYERGEAEPSASALIKIADYYNVSVDYLLGLTEEKRHRP
jgi:transcriptional regulator with XRE-family HTH domain